jgi:DNA gyrase subunit B
VGELVEFRHLRDRLAKRGVPAAWLEAFLRHRPLTRKRISRDTLVAELPRALGRPDVEFAIRAETVEGVLVAATVDGIERVLNLNLFGSGEWAKLLEVYGQIEPFDRPPYTLVTAAGAEIPVASKEGLIDQVLHLGRGGSTVQRYKGLGEMNAEQLWETTMNPETRTLLRVTMDDAVAADDIFTKLMGDQVEPRRDYIATHALEARIDV